MSSSLRRSLNSSALPPFCSIQCFWSAFQVGSEPATTAPQLCTLLSGLSQFRGKVPSVTAFGSGNPKPMTCRGCILLSNPSTCVPAPCFPRRPRCTVYISTQLSHPLLKSFSPSSLHSSPHSLFLIRRFTFCCRQPRALFCMPRYYYYAVRPRRSEPRLLCYHAGSWVLGIRRVQLLA